MRHAMAIGLALVVTSYAIAEQPLPLDIARWDVPSWVAKDSVLRGSATLGASAELSAVECHYELGDGKWLTVACEREENVVTFAIPPLEEAKAERMTLVIRARSKDVNSLYQSTPKSVALADVTELDITGVAAETLDFPLRQFGLDVSFLPCCNIAGGTTRVEHIPVNPEPNRDGLPARVISAFIRATPCPMSKASGGLTLDLIIPKDLDPKPVIEKVKAYRWHESSWKPVFNTRLDASQGVVSFEVPDGGTFVLAEED